MRPEKIDQAKACSIPSEYLSKDHFIELIGKRIKDCEAWEKMLRSQGKLKDAEKMRTAKEQMLRSLQRLK
jgi:hypothetical protein